MTDETYNVVFAYTKEAGGYEGVITWTAFRDKTHFEEWYSKDIKKKQRVIDRGVTQDKAVELANQTPLACDIAACFEEATDPDTGEINDYILEMKLKTVALARSIEK